jgi:hypothetical protein
MIDVICLFKILSGCKILSWLRNSQHTCCAPLMASKERMDFKMITPKDRDRKFFYLSI